MTRPRPASSLVYSQDDALHVAVGEPMPLGTVRRAVLGKWDALYAEALRSACARAFPQAATCVCHRGEEMLRALREQPADFAVLGLTFPDIDGLDILHAIAAESLATRVMLVSSRRDEHSLQALRNARFDGFFDPFDETFSGLMSALRQVAAGQGFLSASLRRRIAAQRAAGVLAPRLTPAELQVLCVIGDGSTDAQAADRLGLSVATVRTHRRNIMRKLEVDSSARLVREAVRLGVVRIGCDGEILRPGFDYLHAARQRKLGRAPA